MTRRTRAWLAGAALLATAAVFLPWARVRTGSGWQSVTALELAPITVLSILLVATAAVALSLRERHEHVADLAAVATLTLAGVVPVLFATLSIASARLAVPGFVPRSLQRLALDVRPGSGAILWSIAAWVALGFVVDRKVTPLRRMLAYLEQRSEGVRGPVAVGLISVMAAWWVRFQPWLAADAGDRTMTIEGWAIPWLGPLGFFALTAAGVALAIGLVGARRAVSVVAVTVGWLQATATSAALVAGIAVVQLTRSAGGAVEGVEGRLGALVAELPSWIPEIPQPIIAEILDRLGDQVASGVPVATMGVAPWLSLGAAATLTIAGLMMASSDRQGALGV